MCPLTVEQLHDDAGWRATLAGFDGVAQAIRAALDTTTLRRLRQLATITGRPQHQAFDPLNACMKRSSTCARRPPGPRSAASRTSLGDSGWVNDYGRWVVEGLLAGGAGAGPDGEQGLECAEDSVEGQAGAGARPPATVLGGDDRTWRDGPAPIGTSYLPYMPLTKLRSAAVNGVSYALMGLLGGFLVEAVEWQAAIRRTRDFPWRAEGEPALAPMLLAVLLRLAAGAGLAFAAGTDHQVNGPFGALAVGIAAPLIVEKLASQVPVGTPVSPQKSSPPAASELPAEQPQSTREIGAGG